MSLPASVNQIYCQGCGTAWDKTDSNGQYYFRSASFAIGSYASPAQIVGATEDMLTCPSCDTEDQPTTVAYKRPAPGIQESPLYERDSRMIDSSPDGGDPGDGDADVVHRVD